MLLPVFLVLLPCPAVGQKHWWVSYGDSVIPWTGYELEIWEVYKSSTLRGAAKDVMYDMWKACERELGNPYAPQDGGQIPFRVNFMRFCVNSRGQILYLDLLAPRMAETETEDARMHRLFRKLKKVRLPPFDYDGGVLKEADLDSVRTRFVVPRLKENVSRENYEWM